MGQQQSTQSTQPTQGSYGSYWPSFWSPYRSQYSYEPETITTGDCRSYNLSKNIISTDERTLRDAGSSDLFQVRKLGIHITLVVVKSRRQARVHYGLLFESNTFVTPDRTTYTKCLVHRVKENVHIIFTNDENKLFEYFSLPIVRKGEGFTVSRLDIGESTNPASSYAEILQKEMSLNFRITVLNPRTHTNCMTFALRTIKTLGFAKSIIDTDKLKETLVKDSWNATYAHGNCALIEEFMCMDFDDGGESFDDGLCTIL